MFFLLMSVAGLMICAIVTYQLPLNPLPGLAAALLSLQMNCPRYGVISCPHKVQFCLFVKLPKFVKLHNLLGTYLVKGRGK